MQAENSDTVKVHYTGWKASNGEKFDSTEGKEPLGITLGQGETIKGFNDAIIGMKPGETKKVKIPKEDAYGERLKNLIAAVPREQFLGKIQPEVGKMLAVKAPHGGIMPAKIVELTETHVMIDLNKPLAGHDLVFEIKLVDIIKKGN